MAECFFDPCETAKCSNYPTAECRVSFCGECTANFYDANGDIISNCDGGQFMLFSEASYRTATVEH